MVTTSIEQIELEIDALETMVAALKSGRARIAEQADPDEDPKRLAARQRQAFNRALAEAIKAQRVCAAPVNGRRALWLP